MELYSIGGYNQVGKNMSALKIKNDVLLFDSGLFIPAIMEIEEKGGYTKTQLRRVGALPDDSYLEKLGLKRLVRALLISHAHLDHVGGVPYVAPKYHAPVISSPYTIEVLKSILKDNKLNLKNKIKAVQLNSTIKIKGDRNYDVEFINMTHSTLQCTFIVVHTKKGAIIYGNDFKLDNFPVIGDKPNYKRLKQIAKQGVKALIIDSLYSGLNQKTPSERIARNMLEDLMLHSINEKKGLLITTFSSHIARLKSIVDFGKKLDRKIIFVGRSLGKYVGAASRIKLAPFTKDISLNSFPNQMRRALKKANIKKSEYMIVSTGHQGEPGSVLDRMARHDLPYNFNAGDQVVFSSSIIPAPINVANRSMLEKRLKKYGVRIFSDIHVSGHGSREDIRDIIELIQPHHIIPSHGSLEQLSPMAELGRELGYRLGKDLHIMQNKQRLKLN